MATRSRPGKPPRPTTSRPPLTHVDEADAQDAPGSEAAGGGASITLSIKLGPMVSFQVEGRNCAEITEALKGFEALNRTVDAMFSDLARRVYPDLDGKPAAKGE